MSQNKENQKATAENKAAEEAPKTAQEATQEAADEAGTQAEDTCKKEEGTEASTVNEEAPENKATDSTTSVVDELTEKLMKSNDSYVRLMADFDNYKKKALKDRADLLKYNGERVFTDMLPIIDDFERAIANLPEEDSPLKEGVLMIHNKFVQFMNTNGVKEIETKDKEFDFNFHEAISMFPVEDKSQKGKIIDCIQKGYLFHDKVIRFSKVVVAE